MRSRMLGDGDTQRTFVLVFDRGDEVTAGLLAFAAEQRITAASLTAVGAFERVTLGYFELERRDYKRIEMHEQVEVLTLTGNLARHDGQPKLHAHVVVGRADATAHGGHLIEATVRPTLEVMLVETPAHLARTIDPETGLALLKP